MKNTFPNIQKTTQLSDDKKQAMWSSIDKKVKNYEKNVIISEQERHSI